LVLEGLSQYVYQNYLTANPDTAVFAFTGSLLSAGGIKISPTNPGSGTIVTPVAQYEDQSNLRGPQRISFSYDITFSNNSAFPGVGGTNPFDLNAQVEHPLHRSLSYSEVRIPILVIGIHPMAHS
jgi:hypothetical protein